MDTKNRPEDGAKDMNRRLFTALVTGVILMGGVRFASTPAGGFAEAAQAALVAQGQFGGAIDPVHRADGIAGICRLGDGQRVLRFGNFKSVVISCRQFHVVFASAALVRK